MCQSSGIIFEKLGEVSYMSHKRLRSLTLISMAKNICHKLNYDELIDRFVELKVKRKVFIAPPLHGSTSNMDIFLEVIVHKNDIQYNIHITHSTFFTLFHSSSILFISIYIYIYKHVYFSTCLKNLFLSSWFVYSFLRAQCCFYKYKQYQI